MGYIRHDAIIAATFDDSRIGRANSTGAVEALRAAMPEEYRKFLVGPVSGINHYDFWCFLPDGSREGWTNSDNVEAWRDRFLALLREHNLREYVGVAFGDDLTYGPIVTTHDADGEERDG